MASHGPLSHDRRRFRCLAATRGGAMPPCDARRAQGRPTCGRTGGGGVSAVSSVAFGVVRSTTPQKGLERHPEQAWAASRYPTATRGGSTPLEGGCGSHGRPASSRSRGSGHLSSRSADLRPLQLVVAKMASHGPLSRDRRRFRCLVATRGGAMPPCDARRAQGRPTCGRTGGGGVSAVSSVAFGAVRSTAPENGR